MQQLRSYTISVTIDMNAILRARSVYSLHDVCTFPLGEMICHGEALIKGPAAEIGDDHHVHFVGHGIVHVSIENTLRDAGGKLTEEQGH